jgi:hypothetical protein
MAPLLASIVANADIRRLALIGLAKNVGKTTATNHLLETLIEANLYAPPELALTSLGLDGEATDAMTGLPKPRYLPSAGMLVATAESLIARAESQGLKAEWLLRLPRRTALGPVALARIQRPGRLVIGGPTLLRDLRYALARCEDYGARLGIIDGAINRLGAASPGITDACILCTGASLAATPSQVARHTATLLERLLTAPSAFADAYTKQSPLERLVLYSAGGDAAMPAFEQDLAEPDEVARWIVRQKLAQPGAIFFLRGALTGELACALLELLPSSKQNDHAELVVEDATKLFCHATALQRLAQSRLHVRVASPIRLLAITISPFTPEYSCSTEQLMEELLKLLPKSGRPPIIDVVSGLTQL